jgi:transcriptional regulator with XRE-family HTH domain
LTSTDFRTARKRLGLTQAALAQALGMSRTQIVDYESGINHKTKQPIVIPRVVQLAMQAIVNEQRQQ